MYVYIYTIHIIYVCMCSKDIRTYVCMHVHTLPDTDTGSISINRLGTLITLARPFLHTEFSIPFSSPRPDFSRSSPRSGIMHRKSWNVGKCLNFVVGKVSSRRCGVIKSEAASRSTMFDCVQV